MTVLRTTIEGPTRLWEELLDEVCMAIAEHDEVLPVAIVGSAGVGR